MLSMPSLPRELGSPVRPAPRPAAAPRRRPGGARRLDRARRRPVPRPQRPGPRAARQALPGRPRTSPRPPAPLRAARRPSRRCCSSRGRPSGAAQRPRRTPAGCRARHRPEPAARGAPPPPRRPAEAGPPADRSGPRSRRTGPRSAVAARPSARTRGSVVPGGEQLVQRRGAGGDPPRCRDGRGEDGGDPGVRQPAARPAASCHLRDEEHGEERR